jgi:predicted acyl esterase
VVRLPWILVVVQDTRGRSGSEGDLTPFMHEGADGYDAVEWATRLPGVNGWVGALGQSYLDMAQNVDRAPAAAVACGVPGVGAGRLLPHVPPPRRGTAGVTDQTRLLDGGDVVVHTSRPLQLPLEITGPVVVEPHAASTAADTDFAATLVDLMPDGFTRSLAAGVVRASSPESLESRQPIRPDEVYGYRMDLWSTRHVVVAGHRLQVRSPRAGTRGGSRTPTPSPATAAGPAGGRCPARPPRRRPPVVRRPARRRRLRARPLHKRWMK